VLIFTEFVDVGVAAVAVAVAVAAPVPTPATGVRFIGMAAAFIGLAADGWSVMKDPL
jgi:hypothetical protein